MRLALCFLLAISFSSLHAQDRKSERFKQMLESDRGQGDFTPYGIYLVTDTIFSPFIRGKMKSAFKSIGRLSTRINALLGDDYFKKYERESSGQRTCGYYVETSPAWFGSYSAFIRKNDIIIERLHRILKKDKDLINIKIYTGEQEFIIANEFFLYDRTFQPKTIDDLRLKKNITSLCVLCWSDTNAFGRRVTNLSTAKVGLLESKHLALISCPIISEGEYLCDVLFTYLK